MIIFIIQEKTIYTPDHFYNIREDNLHPQTVGCHRGKGNERKDKQTCGWGEKIDKYGKIIKRICGGEEKITERDKNKNKKFIFVSIENIQR